MGKLTCTHHLEAVAQFRCMACQAVLCDACADHRWTGKGFTDFCLACKRPLEVLENRSVEAGPRAYLDRAPEFLQFPFKSSVMIMLGGLAVITSALDALGSSITSTIARGIEASIYFHMVVESANGKDDIHPPDFTDLSDIFGPVRRYFVALLPLFAGLVWLGLELALGIFDIFEMGEVDLGLLVQHPGPMLVILLGVALLPLMSIIAAVSHSSFDVINPQQWVRALRIVGPAYGVGAVLFYVVWLLDMMLITPLAAGLAEYIPIPILPAVLVMFISYLPLALRARILGGLIEPYFSDLR